MANKWPKKKGVKVEKSTLERYGVYVYGGIREIGRAQVLSSYCYSLTLALGSVGEVIIYAPDVYVYDSRSSAVVNRREPAMRYAFG